MYPATITKADIHPSKSSQEDTLYLDLAVGEEGRTMHWNTSLQEQSLGRLKQLLLRLDFDIPEGSFEFDEQDLVGVECQVEVTLEAHYRDPKRKMNRIAAIYGSEGPNEEEEQSWG
jgi:hypothetical protein